MKLQNTEQKMLLRIIRSRIQHKLLLMAFRQTKHPYSTYESDGWSSLGTVRTSTHFKILQQAPCSHTRKENSSGSTPSPLYSAQLTRTDVDQMLKAENIICLAKKRSILMMKNKFPSAIESSRGSEVQSSQFPKEQMICSGELPCECRNQSLKGTRCLQLLTFENPETKSTIDSKICRQTTGSLLHTLVNELPDFQ